MIIGPVWRHLRRGLHRLHIDPNLQRMRASAEDQAPQRTHIAIIAAPRERNVSIRRDDVVGGVHIDPADSRAIGRNPRMRSIGADESGLAGRRVGAQIATHVARRKIQGAKAGDLHVGEILTDAAALLEDLFGGRPDVGRLRVETKVGVNARSEIEQRLHHRPSRGERLQRIGSKLRAGANARRLEGELAGFHGRWTALAGQELGNIFPGKICFRSSNLGRGSAVHHHLAARLDHQLPMRLLHGEEAKRIAKIVESLGQRSRSRLDT